MPRLNKTTAKRECMRDRVNRLNTEYDIKISKTPEVNHEDESLKLIVTENDLLKTFCPGFDQTFYKITKLKGRKKRVSKVWTMKDVVEPKMIYEEDVWINKMKDPREFRNKKIKCYVVNDPLADPIFKDIVRLPRCFKCLHSEVKCKYSNTLLEVLGHRANGYRFRSLLYRILGFKWVTDSIELNLKEVIR